MLDGGSGEAVVLVCKEGTDSKTIDDALTKLQWNRNAAAVVEK